MLLSTMVLLVYQLEWGDKIQRLMSIEKTGITMVKSESLRDTLIDLHNYSAMAIMLLDK